MVKVKICGLSTEETLESAISAGADYVGLMFFARSPRNVGLQRAVELREIARGRALTVAVTVNAPDAELIEIAARVGPDLIQAHGEETPERIAVMSRLTGISAYKVLKVRTAAHVVQAEDYREGTPFVMFDAMPPEGAALPGGNGLAFDWTILREAQHPFMLAGGLNPGNVAEAIRVTRAPMVDVSSGVESAPGVKNPALIREFIAAAKAAR